MSDEKTLTTIPQPSPLAVMPVMPVACAVSRHKQMVELVTSEVWKKGIDSDVLPGTKKETLLQPGAQKLGFFFGLYPRFTLIDREQDWTGEQHGGEPLFAYTYKCTLYHGDLQVAESIGSCNSWESKYRWRWVDEADVPEHLDKSKLKKRGGKISEFQFSVDNAETTGKYGKPAEYWQRFKDAIADGTAVAIQKTTKNGRKFEAWEIDTTVYRVPNDDIFSQINTIKKMAQKRAYVGAIITATNGSEFFTQDMEDFIDSIDSTAHVVVDSTAHVVTEVQTPTTAHSVDKPVTQEDKDSALTIAPSRNPTPYKRTEAPAPKPDEKTEPAKAKRKLDPAQQRVCEALRRSIRAYIDSKVKNTDLDADDVYDAMKKAKGVPHLENLPQWGSEVVKELQDIVNTVVAQMKEGAA